MAAQPLHTFYVSVVTIAEIRYGVETIVDPGRRAVVKDWLTNKIRPMFGERILSISEDVMLKWRLLVEDGRKAGYTYFLSQT